jgi:hypothetical protein
VRFARVTIVMALTLALPTAAYAQHSAQALPQTDREEIHYLGKFNVNDAPAEELERVPGLSKADIERIISARESGPITNLKSLKLQPRALKYLRIEGASDFARIRKLPLQLIEGALPAPAPTTPAAPGELNT